MTCLLTLDYLFDVLKGSTFTKEFDTKSMMIGHVGTHMFALQQRWRCFGKQKIKQCLPRINIRVGLQQET